MNQPKVWALIITGIIVFLLLAPILSEIGIAVLLRRLGVFAIGGLIKIGGRVFRGFKGRPPQAKSRAFFEKYKKGLKEEVQNYMSKPVVKDSKLNSIVKRLYKEGATEGSGGTADAVRQELITGQPVKGRWHAQKAREEIKNLKEWIEKNPNAHPSDKSTAEKLLHDLQDSLTHTKYQR